MNITPAPAVLPVDFYVYAHVRASTGEIFYIGKGQRRRAWSVGGRSLLWRRIAGKHGVKVEIVADGLQEWYAFELERELIALHGRHDLGLGPLINFTDGGDGVSGWVPSDDTRRRISESNVKALASPVAKEKMSMAKKGIALPFATRKAMSAARTGLKASTSARSSISAALAGRAKSQQHKMAIREAHAIRVTCVEAGKTFDALIDAARWIAHENPKPARSAICMCCKGQRKSAYGYTWQYAE